MATKRSKRTPAQQAKFKARAKARLNESRKYNPHFSPGEGAHPTGMGSAERAVARAKFKSDAKEKYNNFVSKASNMIDAIDMQFPTTFHAISVHVKGGPSADLRRIWFLACSACFGRYAEHGIVAVRGQTMNAEWDITGKECTIQFAYTVTGAIGAVGAVAFSGGLRPQNGAQLLMRGPDQVTIGAQWPSLDAAGNFAVFTPGISTAPRLGLALTPRNGPPAQFVDRAGNQTNATPIRGEDSRRADVLREVVRAAPTPAGSTTSPGLVANVRSVRFEDGAPNYTVAYTAGAAPFMMDADRIITTGERRDKTVQGPRPSADGLVRGSALEMIVAALASPGYSVVPPVANSGFAQPLASSGVGAAGVTINALPTRPGNTPVPDITGS